MTKETKTTEGRPRSRSEVLGRLQRLLVRREILQSDQMEALDQRATWLKEPFERLLVRDGVADEATVLALLGEITGLPVVRLSQVKLDRAVVDGVPARMAVHYHVVPLRIEDGAIVLACDRIHDVTDEDRIRMLLGTTVRWVFCTSHEIAETINQFYGVGIRAFLNVNPPEETARSGVHRTLADAAVNPDISAFVREIIQDAIGIGATDIHFEPFEERLRLRYRIDGVLHDIPVPAGIERFQRAVISSTKVMAQLNIAEHRLPQDGRFTMTLDGDAFDLRVSVLPSRHGESVNLRILNRTATFLDLDQIALREDQRRLVEELIALPHGILLFTGPTGSGKTTSLYAALARLNDDERKIITIEDPIEYQIDGTTQMQVNPDIGFTFATGLRSVLRHDPDVVLIGEIRDQETADIAINASLTGHLVLSTLHTNDSASAVTRLLDIGIEPYLVASSVEGMIAQRLVRKVCGSCREPITVDGALREEMLRADPQRAATARLYRGRGCPDCRFTGYAGRRAIFEILVMTDAIRALVVTRAASSEMLKAGAEQGLVTLRESGWSCVLDGETTVEDVLRVTPRPR
jgi:general secretion pathway protein E/type IV pilus assembly protein PilB